MYINPTTNYCPGRNLPTSTDSIAKIHFPEHPKIYPLDISMESEQRQLYPPIPSNLMESHIRLSSGDLLQ